MDTVSITKKVELKDKKTGEIRKVNVTLTKIPKDSEICSKNVSHGDEEYSTDCLHFQDDEGEMFTAKLIALHPNEDRPFELKVNDSAISVHATYQWIIYHLLRNT